MGLKETEDSTTIVLERMENTLCNMEQMSFDSINITDRLVTLISDVRELTTMLKSGTKEERDEAFEEMKKILDQLLDTAFTVNNVSHELEKEAVYQRDTTENIRQIVEFLYSVTEDDFV